MDTPSFGLDNAKRVFQMYWIESDTGKSLTVGLLGDGSQLHCDNRLVRWHKARLLNSGKTKAVVQDSATRRRWGVPHAAIIIPETSTGQPYVEPTPPSRTQREEFFAGATQLVHRQAPRKRAGIVIRMNAKTASIAINDTDGHRRVSHSLLQKIVDI